MLISLVGDVVVVNAPTALEGSGNGALTGTIAAAAADDDDDDMPDEGADDDDIPDVGEAAVAMAAVEIILVCKRALICICDSSAAASASRCTWLRSRASRR